MPHSAPRLSAGAEDFRPIEADLEAFSPGRVAAVGVRGRAVIYIAKVNIHVHVTRASCNAPYSVETQTAPLNPFPAPGHASEPSIGRRGSPAAAQAAPVGPW